jgi:molybdopterin-guanine dinucleotide biosynthesis protein A
MINSQSSRNDKTLGLVLCGGKSSRMNSDKGLLVYDHQTWARIAVTKLESLGIPVRISVNINQIKAYALLFDKTLLLEDNEQLDIKGPLIGILSAHKMYPDKDIFVLACDMLLMKTVHLEELVEFEIKNPSNDVYLFKNSNHKEPLCGIYTANSLSKIFNLIENQILINYSMKSALEKLRVCELPIDTKYLANFNAQADVLRLNSEIS